MLPSAINRPACPSFGRPVSIAKPITANPKSPVPPAGEAEMQSISGSGVITPAGVQRAAPSGACRMGSFLLCFWGFCGCSAQLYCRPPAPPPVRRAGETFVAAVHLPLCELGAAHGKMPALQAGAAFPWLDGGAEGSCRSGTECFTIWPEADCEAC